MKETKKKKGISLIVLVITIIVMIVLAATVIISLSNSGIIGKANKAVNETNLAQVQTLAQTIWIDSQLTKDDPATIKNKIIVALGKEADNYNIKVDQNGVKVTLKQQGDGTDDSEWVSAWVGDVPIPKGFVVSPYGADESLGMPAENTKEGGLVIYELTEDELGLTELPTETHIKSLTSRNQYVWVPVKDLTVNTLTRQRFFADDDDDWYYVQISDYDKPGSIINDMAGSYYWEVTPSMDITTEYDDPYYQECIDYGDSAEDCAQWYPTLKVANYTTQRTLDEVKKMYESVEKYGGFYIARYEAGLLQDVDQVFKGLLLGRDNVASRMQLKPYGNIVWSGAGWVPNIDAGGSIEVARSLYTVADEEYGVISTLPYGVQLAAIVQWLKESNYDVTNSMQYGNFSKRALMYEDFNSGASYSNGVAYSDEDFTKIDSTYSKTTSQYHQFTTGALKSSITNNIYDLAGNLFECTMELTFIDSWASVKTYTMRGGSFNMIKSNVAIADRHEYDKYFYSGDFGFRPALYIKVGDQVEKEYEISFSIRHKDGSITTHKAKEGIQWKDWLNSSSDDLTQDSWTAITEIDWIEWKIDENTTYRLLDAVDNTSVYFTSYISNGAIYNLS